MSNKNKRLVRSLAEAFYNLPDKLAILVVEAMKRLVEDKEFVIFNKGASQETKALFAAAELQERPVSHTFYAEDTHPVEAYLLLFRLRTHV